jgi:hypothetical protein
VTLPVLREISHRDEKKFLLPVWEAAQSSLMLRKSTPSERSLR